MKKLREIVEATKSLHPMALHVKPVMVNGQQKYKVHAVGKGLADGINHGEHLSDSELDDAHEMGAKVKHVKEEVEELDELSKTTLGSYAKKASRDAVITRKIGVDFENKADRARSPGMKAASDEISQRFKSKSFKRRAGVDKALDRLTKEETGFGPEADKNITVQLKKANRIAGSAKAKKIETGTRYEETGFGPEADKNITVQLKKAMDMMEHGEKTGSDVEFADGQQHFVEGVIAHKVLVAMEQMKPEIRAQAQNAVYQSFAHLMAAHQMLSK